MEKANKEYWEREARRQDALQSYASWCVVVRRYKHQLAEAEEYRQKAAERYVRNGGDPGVLEEGNRPSAAEQVEAEHVAGLAELSTPPMAYTPPPSTVQQRANAVGPGQTVREYQQDLASRTPPSERGDV